MLPNEVQWLAHQEHHRELLREAEGARQIRAARPAPPGQPGAFRAVAERGGWFPYLASVALLSLLGVNLVVALLGSPIY